MYKEIVHITDKVLVCDILSNKVEELGGIYPRGKFLLKGLSAHCLIIIFKCLVIIPINVMFLAALLFSDQVILRHF